MNTSVRRIDQETVKRKQKCSSQVPLLHITIRPCDSIDLPVLYQILITINHRLIQNCHQQVPLEETLISLDTSEKILRLSSLET